MLPVTHTLLALAAALFTTGALAQADPAYPVKPIRLIVPFAAGGTNDTSGRLVSRELSKALGQSVIVENRGGAGGLIGTEAVLKLPADGYTLLLGSISTLAVLPTVNPKAGYEPLRDITPITQIATLPYVVAVHPSLPVSSLPQLAKLARAQPKSISFASPGYATGAHLTSEYLSSTLAIKLVHVPYKGDGPGVIDLVAGHIPMAVFPPLVTVPHVKSGRLRAIAVTSSERTSALPETKTVAESGYPGFESSSWHGIAARAGTPEGVVARLHKEIAAILARSQDVRGTIEASGARIVGNTPEEFAAYVRQEIAKWKKVVATAGIRIN
ncbi:MAG TPA: tripartite tricarboxylate transporter substrate binding protein [Burkholderiales bacterium]|nr:tripartite tricarboxylate transporter substrate binding protein [Burkholderiales bacterium]